MNVFSDTTERSESPCVTLVEAVDEELVASVRALLPQLSAHASLPDREALERIVASPCCELFVARLGGRIAGMLTLVRFRTPGGEKGRLEDVVTDAALRGRGVGTALVRAALERAEALGLAGLELTSAPARRAAHALYRRMGFVEYATTVFRRRLSDR